MTNFATSIAINFIDGFTPGIQSVTSSFAGVQQAISGISSNPLLETSANLAQATQLTEPLRNAFDNFLSVPSQVAGEIEVSMGAVHSVLNETNSVGSDVAYTYNMMEQAAMDWAAGTAASSDIATTSATNFANTSYSMISAGLDAEAAISATGNALVLAKATKGELSASGDLLATVYNNMGDHTANVGAEMVRLSDIIAKTQGQFQIADLGQLGEGLKYAIPIAKQYGVEMAEISAVTGQLNTSGLGGSMAGTSIGSMMGSMIKANNDLEFGISYNTSGGVEIIETIENIAEKYGPLDQLNESMKLKFQKAFGVEALRGVSLLTSNLDALKSGYDGVLNSAGATAEMAARMSDTYQDKVTRMNNLTEVWAAKIGKSSNAIQGFFLDIGAGALRTISPLLQTPVGDFFSNVIAFAGMGAQSMVGFVSGGLQMASQMTMIASAASSAGGYMNLFKNTMGMLTGPFKAVGGGIANAIKGIFGIGASTAATTPALIGATGANAGYATSTAATTPAVIGATGANIGFAASLWATVWPILAVVGGIALIAGAAYLIANNWESIGTFFSGLWTGISNAAMAVPGMIKDGWDGLLKWFGGVADFFMAPIRAVIDFFKSDPLKDINPLKGITDIGGNILGSIAGGIGGGLGFLGDAIGGGLQAVRDFLPFSDAKKGPLSDLTLSGQKIMSTLAVGVQKDSTLTDAVDGSFSSVIPAAVEKAESANQLMKGQKNSAPDMMDYSVLGLLKNAFAPYKKKEEEKEEKKYVLNIENLNLNGKDINSVMDFFKMLCDEAGIEVRV